MPSRIRQHRVLADELAPAAGIPVRRDPASLALRAAAAPGLDLGSRIGLAEDLQASAGNAATAAALGEVRTDKPQAPPNGVQDLIAAGVEGQRGLTRSTFEIGNMPLFRVRVSAEGSGFVARPTVPRLPSPDHEVWWPSPGKHLLGPWGKGKRWLRVSDDWSAKILKGEERHVADMDLAYDMTWRRVVGVLADMAKAEKPYTGATQEAARDAAWADFKRRLPKGFRPTGDAPTKEAQTALWGPEDPDSVFSKLWLESKRARDKSGEHTPLQVMESEPGRDHIDELMDGQSKIPGPEPRKVMDDAWARLVKP